MNGMWKRTGQPGLWLMGGALMEGRLWSRFLALQIRADLHGMLPLHREQPGQFRIPEHDGTTGQVPVPHSQPDER
jgi:hypothetical protein